MALSTEDLIQDNSKRAIEKEVLIEAQQAPGFMCFYFASHIAKQQIQKFITELIDKTMVRLIACIQHEIHIRSVIRTWKSNIIITN